MAELERCHQEQQTGMQGELKKEVALLQKKLLMESVSWLLPTAATAVSR